MAAAINGNTKLLKRLIGAGANVWAKGPKGVDALHVARKRNQGTVVRLLTELKAAARQRRAAAKREHRQRRVPAADPSSPLGRRDNRQLYGLVKLPRLQARRPDASSTGKMLRQLSSPYQLAAKQLQEAARDRMGAAVSLNHRHIEQADRLRRKQNYLPPAPDERQF